MAKVLLILDIEETLFIYVKNSLFFFLLFFLFCFVLFFCLFVLLNICKIAHQASFCKDANGLVVLANRKKTVILCGLKADPIHLHVRLTA